LTKQSQANAIQRVEDILDQLRSSCSRRERPFIVLHYDSLVPLLQLVDSALWSSNVLQVQWFQLIFTTAGNEVDDFASGSSVKYFVKCHRHWAPLIRMWPFSWQSLILFCILLKRIHIRFKLIMHRYSSDKLSRFSNASYLLCNSWNVRRCC